MDAASTELQVNIDFVDCQTLNIIKNSSITAICEILRNISNDNNNVESGYANAAVIGLYSLVVMCSLFGNSLVMHVALQTRTRPSRTNILIANLAASDLLMTTLNIPFSTTRLLLPNWPFGQVFCWLVPFFQVTFVYVSTFTMTWIAFDRYTAIVHPLKSRRVWVAGIVSVWVSAALLSLPHGIFNQLVTVVTYRRLVRCQVRYPTSQPREFQKYLTLVTFLTQYFIPLTLTAIVYTRVAGVLYSRGSLGAMTRAQAKTMVKSKRLSVKMLIFVVICFAICWLPLNIYNLLTDFEVVKIPNLNYFLVCHWIAMSSVCYNPFIYCWLNAGFRNGVWTSLKWLFCCVPGVRRTNSLFVTSEKSLDSPETLGKRSFRHKSVLLTNYGERQTGCAL